MSAEFSSWTGRPANLQLPREELHVWLADLDHPALTLWEMEAVLVPDERQRAERFRAVRDRQRFAICRGMLRFLLGAYLDTAPQFLRFVYGPQGKPALAELTAAFALHFNLAHAHGLVLFALSRDREIGVDLELVRPIPEMEHISERFFAPGECSALRQLEPEQRQEAFFHCWTRKEAFVKAKGAGLSHPLDRFEVSLTPGERARLLTIDGDRQAAAGWTIRELRPAPGYVAALAVPGLDGRLVCRRWERAAELV
jgi:4'-phosphopantetheinyl transferase